MRPSDYASDSAEAQRSLQGHHSQPMGTTRLFLALRRRSPMRRGNISHQLPEFHEILLARGALTPCESDGAHGLRFSKTQELYCPLPAFDLEAEFRQERNPKTVHDHLHKRREAGSARSEEHTSELQSRQYLVCRLLLEKKKITK